jgi:hypothetical protein
MGPISDVEILRCDDARSIERKGRVGVCGKDNPTLLEITQTLAIQSIITAAAQIA